MITNTKVKHLSKYLNTMDCISCFSIKTKKHGILKSGAQRYQCKECEKTFIVGGRGSYSDTFKEDVVEKYCHKGSTSREIIKHYNISSRTLIKRSKDHRKNCIQCSNVL